MSRPRRGFSAVVVAIALCVTGVAAIAGWMWFRHAAGTGAPENAQTIADPFLAKLRGGEVDAAWSETTAEFKSDLGRDSFRELVGRVPAFKESLQFVETSPAAPPGAGLTDCVYKTPQGVRGGPLEVHVLLAHESGQWRVERLRFDPPLAALKRRR